MMSLRHTDIWHLISGNMAVAPRQKKNAKATKVAFKILGVPGNMRFKRSKEQEQVNKQLIAQETARAR